MVKQTAFVFAILLSFSNCFADTFVHRQTGKSFNGYVVQRKRGDKTQVRAEKRRPQYLDLSAYEVHRNNFGRKNKVFVFSLSDSLDLISETEAFEGTIVTAANRGPLFILIEIDMPGGRVDLVQRICAAITQIDNCTTVAFVSGGKFGGAFSAGAIIALACDKVYMHEGTATGAAAPYVETSSGPQDLAKVYGQAVSAKFTSAWEAYCSAVAERNGRPGLLAKAMVGENIEVVEVLEDGKRLFIEPKNKQPSQSVVRTWSDKGSLLTLTATEAVQAGIADKVVASREELFADLAATKAAKARDTSLLRARREFERAQRTIDRILSSISYLETRAAALVKDLDALEEEIRRLDRTVFRGYYGYYGSHLGMMAEWESLLRNRDELSGQLLFILDDLIRNHRNALSVADRHPDLRHHVSTLEKGLDSAEATYRQVRLRRY